MKNIFLMICLLATAVAGVPPSMSLAAEGGVYTHTVGEFKVYLLSDGASRGKSEVLLGADEEALKKYVPDGTYPTAYNSFLVRTPQHTILVDTGLGKLLHAQLESLDIAPDAVDAVLLTHMHADHIGGLLREEKAAFPNAKLYLAQQERVYWSEANLTQDLSETQKQGFAKAEKALEAYGQRVQVFSPAALDADNAKDLLPGIRPVAAFGHTPGHTMYLVHSGDDRLLIWGDLVHALAIQIPLPEVAVTYDLDPESAIATRKAVLEYASRHALPVAGMHLPFPGIGKVRQQPDETYTFIFSSN